MSNSTETPVTESLRTVEDRFLLLHAGERARIIVNLYFHYKEMRANLGDNACADTDEAFTRWLHTASQRDREQDRLLLVALLGAIVEFTRCEDIRQAVISTLSQSDGAACREILHLVN